MQPPVIPIPATVRIQSKTGFNAAGNAYAYNYDYTHQTLRISQGGTELTTNAAISVDTILFKASFPRF